jgi:hypothetical protein
MTDFNTTMNNINNGLNNASNAFGGFTQQTVQFGQALNGLNNALNGMPTDTYTPGSTMANPSGKVDLKPLFASNGQYWPNPLENKFADRLSWFGIKDSQEFVEAASTPFKRSLMSFLVGFGNDRTYIRQKIDQWTAEADLVRTGASLNDAKLMHMTGAIDSTYLGYAYGNPINRSGFYAAMGANAMQYGFMMPSMGAVTAAVERAKTLPPIVRWS